MLMTTESHYLRLAAAFVRGRLSLELDQPLDSLSERRCEELCEQGTAAGLKLHKFKRTMGLERVRQVLGVVRGLNAHSILDIGSGRGTFLWTFIDALPEIEVTCIDASEQRVRDINAVASGGIPGLRAVVMDAQNLQYPDNSFDATTALEVLEHMQNPAKALREILRVTRNFVIVSVPKHEDDNPEHIQLFAPQDLKGMLEAAGARNVNLQYTAKEIIAVAKI